jgi:hypothetical protein
MFLMPIVLPVFWAAGIKRYPVRTADYARSVLPPTGTEAPVFEDAAIRESPRRTTALCRGPGRNRGETNMAIGTSIFLLAVGAILRFAVYYSIRGIAVGVVGIVLMIAGALGLLLSFTVLSRTSRRRTVVQSGPTAVPGTTTTVAREETYSDEPVNW